MRKGKFFQKKENLLFVTLLTCFLMLLAGCSGGGGSNSTEEPNQVPEDKSSTVTLTGNAAKGPFVPGASVQVYEILDNGTRGELLKSSTITSLLGDYSVTLESNACDYVLVEVTGKYFQETDGKNSTANATLKAVFKPGSVDKINGNINGNINIATTLAAERFMYLLQQGKNKDEAYELANANALNFITSVLDINSTEIDKLTDGNEFAGVALLVDDSSTARKAMKTALEHMGFDVVEAFDGEDAIEKIEQQYNSLGESRFQHEMRIIVSDIEMPRMDGFHFASKIKNDTRFKHIPILFNSSISGEFSKEKGREVGGDGYLIKFQPKKFYEEVKRVLTRDD